MIEMVNKVEDPELQLKQINEEKPGSELQKAIKSVAKNILDIYPNGFFDLLIKNKSELNNVGVILSFNSDVITNRKYKRIDAEIVSLSEFEYSAEGKKTYPDEINGQIKYEDIELLIDKNNKEEIKDYVIKRRIESIKNIYYLTGVFEKFVNGFDGLLREIIKQFAVQSTNTIKTRYPEFYEIAKSIISEMPKKKNKKMKSLNKEIQDAPFFEDYFEISYENFIVIFCSIIRYFTNLDIKIDVNKSEQEIWIYFFADEKTLNRMTIKLKYDLQLHPAAIDEKYEELKTKLVQEQIKYSNEEISQPLLNDDNEKRIVFQFENYDINDPVFWPPYMDYVQERDNKYRRYVKGDKYHQCDYIYGKSDKPCRLCSKFRGIDKIRLIYSTLDSYVIFQFLLKEKIMNNKIIKRDYMEYQKHFENRNLIKLAYNPFNYKNCDIAINILRNYFGESVSFYFLWLDNHARWLLFPSIVGIILFLLDYFMIKIPVIDVLGKKVSLDSYDCALIIFLIIISLWLTFYINVWKQKEKIYSHIWGMNDSNARPEFNENFEPNDRVNLIFGTDVPIESKRYHMFKKVVSSCVLFLMISLVIFFVVYLFQLKLSLINDDPSWNRKVSIFIASVNALQIKAMNYIYYYVAIYLNEWENHLLLSTKNQSLTIKLVLFDFMNSYCSLFYIAFYKPYNEGCVNNNCLNEIETQLYSVFLIYICVYVFEIAIPIIIKQYKIRSIYSKFKGKAEIDVLQSLEHQMLCEPVETMNFHYNEYISQFGYVCLFSVAAPLAPVIMFILVLFGRVLNQYRIINLQRIEIIEGSKGIGMYNSTLKALLIGGIISNVAIVLFSSPNLAERNMTIDLIKSKFVFFALIENFVIIVIYFVNWNIIPGWFNYIDQINELYQTNFFLSDTILKKNNKKKTNGKAQ